MTLRAIGGNGRDGSLDSIGKHYFSEQIFTLFTHFLSNESFLIFVFLHLVDVDSGCIKNSHLLLLLLNPIIFDV
jgi:hypothetical protein